MSKLPEYLEVRQRNAIAKYSAAMTSPSVVKDIAEKLGCSEMSVTTQLNRWKGKFVDHFGTRPAPKGNKPLTVWQWGTKNA